MNRIDLQNRFAWQFCSGRAIDHSVPEYWLPALTTMCAGIDAIVDQNDREYFYWRDIKEKHGHLAVDYAAPADLIDAIEALIAAAESACHEADQAAMAKVNGKRFLRVPLNEVKATALQAGEDTIKRRLASGLPVSGLDESGGIVHYSREQVEADHDDAKQSANALKSDIDLIAVDVLAWQGVAVPAWLPIGDDSKALCGAVLYLEEMPLSLQTIFRRWLAEQALSISRPPLGLPRQGQAYFFEDVLTAIEANG